MEGGEEVARSEALLFTLRVWRVNGNAHALEWRVRLQNVHSGEVHYCNNGKALIALLDELLLEFLNRKE